MKDRITLQKLKDLGACSEAITYAAERFNGKANGVSSSEFLRQIPRGDWLIWWLWNSGAATIEQCIMLGCVAGRRSLRFVREQDRVILVAAFDAAEAVAANNTAATRSAAAVAAVAASAMAASAARSAARSATWLATWLAARSAARSAAQSAESAAQSAAESAESAVWSARSAVRSAVRSAESAALLVLWSSSSSMWSAVWLVEHLASADDMRTAMKTARYRRASKSGAVKKV